MKILQTSTYTDFRRYAAQWRIAQNAAVTRGYRRCLVFGGSFGLEAFQLAAALPDIEIVSVEIDREALRASRGYNRSARIELLLSTWRSIELRAPYDLIVANSVLCDHPASLTAETLRSPTFEAFCDVMDRLLGVQNPGGLFMACNANYALMDAPAAAGLTAELPLRPLNGFTAQFDATARKRIDCVLGGVQLPCFYAAPDADADAAFGRLCASLLFRPDGGPTPGAALREAWASDLGETIAVIDPFTAAAPRDPERRGRPLSYTVRVARSARQPGASYLAFERAGAAFDIQPMPSATAPAHALA